MNVFSEEEGPENFEKPFPVPPKVEVMICVRLAVPSNEFPYMFRAVPNEAALPLVFWLSVGTSEA